MARFTYSSDRSRVEPAFPEQSSYYRLGKPQPRLPKPTLLGRLVLALGRAIKLEVR